ncbi:hypothetical protein OG948_54560 (plasmid) [Embleya sp. NBC_00888]|uniref:hypothetical protein n=1 Tax=Embleya sp. NBC_00888 TaxID=2975960 RepID=UPI002F90AD6D|nr:hypothetical protein OG948_54560 [Embleya sp. NBC_00888]
MWAPGTVFGDRYTLAEQLIDGSAAEVWSADDAVLGQRVVMKILHPELGAHAVAVERFRGEARLAATLSPPGIVGVHRRDGTEGIPEIPYVVVQFVDRSALSGRAAANGSIAYDQIPDVVAQTLEALHARHRHAIVRRDVEQPAPTPRTLDPATRRPARRRSRKHRTAVAALPAAAVIAAVATALFVLHSPADTTPEARNGGPTNTQTPVAPGTASPEATPQADTGAPTAPGTAPAGASEDPTTAPATGPLSAPDGPAVTGSSAPVPPPAADPVRPTPTGATKRTAAGSTGSTQAGGTSANSGARQPNRPVAKPAAAAPAAAPAVPAGCGGSGWAAITNVGDGTRIGIDTASPGVGSRLVMGGHTEYGWVTAQVGPWKNIRACNTSGLTIVPTSGGGGSPSLGTAVFTDGLLNISAAPTSGASLITGFTGTQCLTDNGPGRQLTFAYCVPGNKAQQWYIR